MTFVQYHTAPIQGIYQQCIEQVRSKVDEYELFDEKVLSKYPDIDFTTEIRSSSDALRCHLLYDNPSRFWLDTDCMLYDKINELVIPSDGRAYCYQNPGFLDSSAFYANGNREVFKKILDRYYGGISHKTGWLQNLINTEYREYFAPIPDGYIIHLNLGIIGKYRDKQWGSIGMQDVSIVNNNGKPEITYVKGIIE